MASLMNLSRPCCRLRPRALNTATLHRQSHLSLSQRWRPHTASFSTTPCRHEAKSNKPPATRNSSDTQMPSQGSLGDYNIFHSFDEVNLGIHKRTKPRSSTTSPTTPQRNPIAMAAALDPQPSARRRWERKKVMQTVRRRGRISKTLALKRTERESTSKSDLWQTSVKKLNPLARQIAGKTVEEAMTQMQFSKKKQAPRVRRLLQHALEEAVAVRGMGLGAAEGRKGEKVVIRLKDGSQHTVSDRTSMYVDQAWVNKGPYGMDTMKRARGKRDRLRLPQTNISVLLKEEATRVRLHQERREKEKNKKPWIQLPDRPITAQRPYYSW